MPFCVAILFTFVFAFLNVEQESECRDLLNLINETSNESVGFSPEL